MFSHALGIFEGLGIMITNFIKVTLNYVLNFKIKNNAR